MGKMNAIGNWMDYLVQGVWIGIVEKLIDFAWVVEVINLYAVEIWMVLGKMLAEHVCKWVGDRCPDQLRRYSTLDLRTLFLTDYDPNQIEVKLVDVGNIFMLVFGSDELADILESASDTATT